MAAPALPQSPDVWVLGDGSCTSRFAQVVSEHRLGEETGGGEARSGALTQEGTQGTQEEALAGKGQRESVRCVCPGDFATHGHFIVHTPAAKRTEPSQVTL